MKPEDVLIFDSREKFHSWLAENHASKSFQWVGFYKKAAGISALSYPDAVEEALCFGWIDGQLGGIDDRSHAIRFTPRRKGSVWSNVNVKRMDELIAAGRVQPSGLAAYEARRADRTGVYSAENPELDLSADLEARFQASPEAWASWNRQPPGYRRQAKWWVMTAKREETRIRRLDALIAVHGSGNPIDMANMPRMSQK